MNSFTRVKRPSSEVVLSSCCDRESLKDVLVQVRRAHKCYDISATKVLEGRDVQAPTMFICELRIPEANYMISKSVVYYPGDNFIIIIMCLYIIIFHYRMIEN
jgi:hypothetical protein